MMTTNSPSQNPEMDSASVTASGSPPQQNPIYAGSVMMGTLEVVKEKISQWQISSGVGDGLVVDRKDEKRVYIRCRRHGKPKYRPDTMGKRFRPTVKCDCHFSVQLEKKWLPIVSETSASQPDSPEEAWLVKSVEAMHNHTVQPPPTDGKFTISSSKDERIVNFLREETRICGTRPTGFANASKTRFELLNPGLSVSLQTVKNAIQNIMEVSSDCADLVAHLEKLKEAKKLGFLRYEQNDAGILTYICFAAESAKTQVSLYGREIASVDSTFKISRYTFTLISYVIVDCEHRTVPVLFALTTSETTEVYRKTLQDYETAFTTTPIRNHSEHDAAVSSPGRGPLPKLLISDGDPAIAAALCAVGGNCPPRHLLCSWHLLDLDLPKQLGSCLKGGAGEWQPFRKDLDVVRRAAIVEEAELLWSSLLDKWFDTNPQEVDAMRIALGKRKRGHGGGKEGRRKLLDRLKSLYGKKKKWWLSHYLEEPTLGTQSTQRSESWHAKLKKKVGSALPLCEIVDVILSSTAPAKISLGQMQRRNIAIRRSFVGWKEILSSKNIGFFAADLLENEVKRASTVSMLAVSTTTSPDMGHSMASTEGTCTIRASMVAASSMPQVTFVLNFGTLEASQSRIHIRCGCNYPQRMLLPCAHVIAAAQEFSRKVTRSALAEEEENEAAVAATALAQALGADVAAETGSLYHRLLICSINKRWCHRDDKPCPEDPGIHQWCDTDSNHHDGAGPVVPEWGQHQGPSAMATNALPSPTHRMAHRGRREDENGVILLEGFPSGSHADGNSAAHGVLRGVFNSAAAELTRDPEGCIVAATVARMIGQVTTDWMTYRAKTNGGPLTPAELNKIKDVLVRRGCASALTGLPPPEGASLSQADMPDCSLPEPPAEAAPPRSICNPPTRRHCASESGRSVRRTKEADSRRKRMAQHTPPTLRGPEHRPPGAPAPQIEGPPSDPRAGGWACPWCDGTKVCSSHHNIRQHVRSRHPEKWRSVVENASDYEVRKLFSDAATSRQDREARPEQ